MGTKIVSAVLYPFLHWIRKSNFIHLCIDNGLTIITDGEINMKRDETVLHLYMRLQLPYYVLCNKYGWIDLNCFSFQKLQTPDKNITKTKINNSCKYLYVVP